MGFELMLQVANPLFFIRSFPSIAIPLIRPDFSEIHVVIKVLLSYSIQFNSIQLKDLFIVGT